MPTYLIDGLTPLPENGETGWGNKLNSAITSIDDRFTWTSGEAVAKKVAASGITGTTLPATLTSSSLTSFGTLTSLTVSGTTTVSDLVPSGTSFNLVNATATTVNFAGAATTLTIGATTGTTTVRNALVVTGNLTVNGTTTTVNSTTISVDDINVVLGDTASPTDTSANGGGITLKGATDKTINWVQSTAAWTSSEDFNLLTGKVYEINGTSVLSATTLGSGVTSSSLTGVGTISSGTWQGTLVAGQYGGTGVANTGKTITVSGNTTIGSSTHTVEFVTSGNTSVTLPTTGTLVNSAVTSLSSLATVGTITSGTWNGTTIALARGGTGQTSAPAARAALTGFTSVTSAGQTTLTNASSHYQRFAGTEEQSVKLPVTGTLQVGWSFNIVNNSPSPLVVYSSGGFPVISIPMQAAAIVTCIGTSLTTAADWIGGLSDFTIYTGTGALVLSASPTLTTPTATTSLATGSASFDLINTTATTVNFAGAATALAIGATTGTTTVRNGLTVTGPTILGPAVLTQQSSGYTLALTDAGDILEMTNGTDVNVTIPPESSVNFPTGTQIVVVRNSTGKVQFVPGVGVTLRSDASKQFISTQYSAATLVKRGSNEWYLIGNLSAS
jgi:hypothetical protein